MLKHYRKKGTEEITHKSVIGDGYYLFYGYEVGSVAVQFSDFQKLNKYLEENDFEEVIDEIKEDMTKLMPVVGKRYKNKKTSNMVDVVALWEGLYIVCCKDTDTIGRLADVENFDKYFEELPEEPTNTKVKQSKNNEWTDKKHLDWIYDRLIHQYKESPNFDYMLRFKEIIDNFRMGKCKEPTNAKNAQVEKAKEDLRDYFCESLLDTNDVLTAMYHYRFLRDKTQNLLNALDEQNNTTQFNSNTHQQYTPVVDEQDNLSDDNKIEYKTIDELFEYLESIYDAEFSPEQITVIEIMKDAFRAFEERVKKLEGRK